MSVSKMSRFDWFLNKSGIKYNQHQYDGVEWIIHNETRDDILCRGGLIADEMGLGKTITMIGVMVCNFMKKTLIVLPNILIDQWVKEIYRTTGHKALVYYGTSAKKKITLDQLNNAVMVITSYGTISRLKDKPVYGVNGLLHEVKWNRILFDEAHHLRNKNSRYLGAKMLCSPIKWLISGTPVQNKRKDFFNLCSVIGLASSYCTAPENLDEIFRNHVLRRTKKQVGILIPELKMINIYVNWKSESERYLSENIHKAISYSSGIDKLHLYIRARQMCILPCMLKDKVSLLVKKRLIEDKNNCEGLIYSSKMDSLLELLLSRIGNGNGKLVFCHFRAEIDEIIRRLNNNGVMNVASFDGRTPGNVRNKILCMDNEILVLQIQTGCEGLNLQDKFSEVYFNSPNWNPAVEDQAIARCHRIGQVKDVFVFKFNMGGLVNNNRDDDRLSSFDQHINVIQEEKREIKNEFRLL